MRKVFLENLPRCGKIINWKNSIGCEVNFIYEEVTGNVKIVAYNIDTKRIYFLYLGCEYDMHITNFTNCCLGKVLKIRTNDFKIDLKKIINEHKVINRERRIDEKGRSWKYYLLKCMNCQYEYWIEENNLLKHNLLCKKCGDGNKYPEKFIVSLLDQLNLDYASQLSKNDFKWCGDKKYDFYLYEFDTIIEVHGGQHYKYSIFKRTLEEEQRNDRFKKELALNNGITNYIVIDARKSEIDWIKNSVVCSELNEIFDLRTVDWEKCGEFGLKNRIKEICKYYEENQDLTQKDLSNIFKCHVKTIREYLRKGEELGWCSNVKERAKTAKKNSSKGKKVFCIELNESFNSVVECSHKLTDRFGIQFNFRGISFVCCGNRDTYKGFHFKYID